jgi:hypothetical protein
MDLAYVGWTVPSEYFRQEIIILIRILLGPIILLSIISLLSLVHEYSCLANHQETSRENFECLSPKRDYQRTRSSFLPSIFPKCRQQNKNQNLADSEKFRTYCGNNNPLLEICVKDFGLAFAIHATLIVLRYSSFQQTLLITNLYIFVSNPKNPFWVRPCNTRYICHSKISFPRTVQP